jgi:peroxiredoxin
MCAFLALVSLGIGMIQLHQMAPLNPDSSAYAPLLAPPVIQNLPGVGTSVGCLAPDFTLPDLNGQQVSLSDYRGQLVILNFWTYCNFCKEELPYIQTAYDNCGSIAPDLVVLEVSVNEQLEQVQQFISYYGYTFKFLLDPWGTVSSVYYLDKIPTTFFINKNGIIEDVQVGAFSGSVVVMQKITELANSMD